MVASYSPEFYERMQKFWQQRQLTKGRPPSKEEMQATIQAALREAGISAEETRRSKVAEGYEAERLQLSRDALAQQKKLAEPNPWQTGIGVVGSVGSLALGYSALKGQGVLGTAKGAGTAIGAAGTTTGTAAGAGELGALGAEGFVPTAGAAAGAAAPSSWSTVGGSAANIGTYGAYYAAARYGGKYIEEQEDETAPFGRTMQSPLLGIAKPWTREAVRAGRISEGQGKDIEQAIDIFNPIGYVLGGDFTDFLNSMFG